MAFSLQPPDVGFVSLAGFAMDPDAKTLYLLDPPRNAVWVYIEKDGSFSEFPTLFFSDNPPTGMSTSLDILATDEEIYLLFQDGHISLCTVSQMKETPTRCYDPVTLQDDRPGHQSGATITDGIFTQMSFAAPPDPSLYLLVPQAHAIYRFSPRPDSLNLQGQFRATVEQSSGFSEPATAMAMSLKRYLFISMGNQVHYATDVP
jgi:hypothetical protein